LSTPSVLIWKHRELERRLNGFCVCIPDIQFHCRLAVIDINFSEIFLMRVKLVALLLKNRGSYNTDKYYVRDLRR
jgi:hypothetical protein